MERPLCDQIDVIHVECSRHMRVLDFDDKTGNFLVGCDACHLQLIVQRFVPEPEKVVEDVAVPIEEPITAEKEEPITAESDPKTNYVPKRHIKK